MGSGSSKAKKGPAASAKTKSVKKQKPPVKVSKTKMENDAEIAPALLRRRDTIKRTMSRKSISFNSKGRRKSLAPTVKQPSADSLASEGMERRGVSASFLEAFQTLIFENLEDGINLNQKLLDSDRKDATCVTTALVCSELCKPMTADSKCAFIDLFTDEKDENGIPFVADANVFASHAWKYDAFDVIDCMLEYDQEQEQAGNTSPRYFWFDTVVVCQWEQEGVAVRTQQWWAETFKKSIGEIGTTLLMLLPWHDPIPMTRAWCIWEVLSTLDTGANLHVRMPSSQMMDFCEQLTDHKNALVDTAFKTLESIDCRQASAWLEADRLMILNAVESSKDVYAEGGVKFSGFHGTNMAVKAQIRQWFVNIAREAEETYFDDLEIADPLEQITKRAYLQFNVGTLLKKLGYIVEAEAKWLEALAECNQSVIGTSMYKALTKDIDVVGALHLQLGLSFKSQNKLDDALDQIEHAVEFYSTNVGKADDHPFRTTLGKAKVNEGLVRLARKETESAIICFEDGIAEYTRAGGGSTDFASPDMVDGWSNLAAAHQSLVRPGPKSERSDADSLHIEKAAEYFRKVEAGLTKLKLAKSLPAARLEQNVGLLEKSNENWEEAVKRCKKAVKLFEQIQGHNSMEVAAAIYSVGTCYYEKSLSVSDSKQVNSELKNAKRELNEAAKVIGVCANVPPNHPTQRAIENALVLVQKAIQ